MNSQKQNLPLFSKSLLWLITSFLLMFLTIRMGTAAETNIKTKSTITQIEFNGLKKTSQSWLLYFSGAQEYINKDIRTLNEHTIKQRLLSTNLFSKISFTKSKTAKGTVVTINVEEKASLIPLPMISGNGDSVSFGLFLAEMNFVGMGKMLFMGINYSKKGLQANIGYIDNAFITTNMSFTVSAELANKVTKNRDSKRNVYSQYLSDRVDPYYALGYKLYADLSLTYYGRFSDFSVKLDPDNFNVPNAVKLFYQGAKLEYKKLFYKDYLSYGMEALLEYRHGFSATSGVDDIDIFMYSIKQTFLLGSNHLLRIAAIGGYGDRPTIAEERIGGQYGFRTLAMDEITADDYYSFTLEYEFPFITMSWSTITLSAFYEAGQLRHRNSTWQTFYGPGAGIKLYLSDVAIPAIGIDFAWNQKTENLEFSFSVGVKM